MENRFIRTESLLGTLGIEKLNKSSVIIFGVGGVGGQVCEILARSGVGKFTLVDNDIVNITNINRQIIALESSLNELKVDVMKKRILDINPHAKVETKAIFFDCTNIASINLEEYDYVVDAIDSIKSKVLLICEAKKRNIPIISAMGAGNKTNPLAFKVAKLNQTSMCPLAKTLRYELKKYNITDLKVVYSTEQPHKTNHPFVGSLASITSTMGNILANEVIFDLIEVIK